MVVYGALVTIVAGLAVIVLLGTILLIGVWLSLGGLNSTVKRLDKRLLSVEESVRHTEKVVEKSK